MGVTKGSEGRQKAGEMLEDNRGKLPTPSRTRRTGQGSLRASPQKREKELCAWLLGRDVSAAGEALCWLIVGACTATG